MRICIYYFIGIVFAILSGIFLLQGNLSSFGLALGFLILLFLKISFTKGKILTLFFISIIGFVSIVNYYNTKEVNVNSQNFRIVSKTSKDLILKSISYDSRRYILKNYPKINEINEGMILNIDGKISKQNYYDIGVSGEIFDYSVNRIYGDFIYKFYNMKSVINEIFVQNFGESRGNILSGLTFGDTSGIDSDYKQNLKSMGISHILSVSGFHMNVIFGMISKILSLFPSTIVGFLYLIFTGTKVSGIRAFVMMVLKQFAPRLYRTYDSINALFFAGIFILIVRPYEIFNMGFVYSFASTLGIVMFNRKINDYLYRFPKIISDSLSLTLSAQVFILPILLLSERKIGFRFLFSNMMLVPFYSFLIIFGILFVFFNVVPILKDLISYFIKIIFDIIDGGLMLIENLVPQEFYLDDSTIIFIICLYVIYFLGRKISFTKIKNISIGLYCILFLYMNSLDLKIEYGKYFERNYVIFRNKFKSYMYIDGRINDTSNLEDKLGVDKIVSRNSDEEIKFFGNNIYMEFKQEGVILKINHEDIYFQNYENKDRYYDSIYPKKYYVIF